jgi:hypothetical protein
VRARRDKAGKVRRTKDVLDIWKISATLLHLKNIRWVGGVAQVRECLIANVRPSV